MNVSLVLMTWAQAHGVWGKISSMDQHAAVHVERDAGAVLG
jgi:uncharacterized protein with beta-barrel porin domain